MLDSIALYIGGASTLVGAIALLRRRTRKSGAALLGGGLWLAVIALAWPVSEQQVARPVTHQDAAMPRWQFNEVHEIHVDADPQRVYAAIHAVTANEIRFFKLLTAIRRGGRKGPESIMNAPDTKPILDVATQAGFRYLTDEPGEIVVWTRVASQTHATMNFLIAPEARGTRLTTETRVFADNAKAARSFAFYWRAIHPGSDIIRRMWLRAVKSRAEAG